MPARPSLGDVGSTVTYHADLVSQLCHQYNNYLFYYKYVHRQKCSSSKQAPLDLLIMLHGVLVYYKKVFRGEARNE